MGDIITAAMHVTQVVGDELGVRCTACGHETKNHDDISFGLWECNICGRRCRSIFSG